MYYYYYCNDNMHGEFECVVDFSTLSYEIVYFSMFCFIVNLVQFCILLFSVLLWATDCT